MRCGTQEKGLGKLGLVTGTFLIVSGINLMIVTVSFARGALKDISSTLGAFLPLIVGSILMTIGGAWIVFISLRSEGIK